ncbi:hypothetical protein BGW36DRAFT_413333 [Talaromyces proteolyticus]|uniref:magnesium chelatase n=1 Tax=Talaromyces proteolyticus TaxID=1131652 RepID=A0AAD4Q6I0_9EURO|nr:uncharacterized protein BGW36DRAFT_413333 [Talaromyces proteolyticus]KAH8705357.1 hypothetical protein BGW36DRAFT_413333 [Talaromyces proteolyticus]
MDPPAIDYLVSNLSDLELALLLSLVCQEHCLIETPVANVDDVSGELALICERAFGLSYAILDFTPDTSLDDFSSGILAPERRRGRYYGANVDSGTSSSQSRAQSRFPLDRAYLDERKIVNVIIAKNFNVANDSVQIQALELIRSKRIFTRKSVHPAQKTFLFLPVIGYNASRRSHNLPLNKHLNDHLLFCHFHELNAGYPNLEDDESWISEDRESLSSVVRKRHGDEKLQFGNHYISENIISDLHLSSKNVSVSAEVGRYLQNIVVFLRLNRAVVGGISARATKHFYLVAKALASLHSIDYLTPSIVDLAAKKVYRHRINIGRTEDDRSLQYGSQPESVELLLRGVDADQVIETVISEVESPL